jgi:hypothetical protein
MGIGRGLTRLATLGAAIGGVIFFWRKRQQPQPGPAAPPTAADKPPTS